ncbi:unnamed protein product, partial [Urochloa humidicola]
VDAGRRRHCPHGWPVASPPLLLAAPSADGTGRGSARPPVSRPMPPGVVRAPRQRRQRPAEQAALLPEVVCAEAG